MSSKRFTLACACVLAVCGLIAATAVRGARAG